MRELKTIVAFVSFIAILTACSKKDGCTDPIAINFDSEASSDNGTCVYESTGPKPYTLNIPTLFAQTILPPYIPADNRQTIEGVALGRKLFFDPILSGDNTLACASCHSPEFSFTDSSQFSTGITMQQGNRNSMALYNVAWNWNGKFFWDGRANSLEEQALGPVTNPIEMNNTWPNAVASLQATSTYPTLFEDAFGTSVIDSTLVAKALAQFERTLISSNSKFDQYLLGQTALTTDELEGFNLYMDENGGDCFHCHGSPNNPLWTDNDFHNNGLDATFTDNGYGDITGNAADNGKFKTPSLRNLAYTAPYMHDGRFKTLDEVLDHYSTGLVSSSTIDPLLKYIGQGGVQLTPPEKVKLKAFLNTLNDPGFTTNPDFQAP